MKTLTPAERQALKARAHALRPVVMISDAGLTANVLAEIDKALAAHELIKIRVLGADRDARDRLLDDLCAATGAVPVQHIGKILVAYRERPETHVQASATRPAVKQPAARRPGGTPRGASARGAGGRRAAPARARTVRPAPRASRSATGGATKSPRGRRS